jgi:Common central domain of tyrosinase
LILASYSLIGIKVIQANAGADHGVVETSPHWFYTGHSGTPVQDGMFGGMNVTAIEYLNRNFTMSMLNSNLPAREIISTFYTAAAKARGYADWWSVISVYHGLLHNDLGGHMKTHRSPVDPIFYMHHAYYDRLWDQAQAGWKAAPATNYTAAQYDFDEGCMATSKLTDYQNVFADVLDSNVNLGVQYAPRGGSGYPTLTTSRPAAAATLYRRRLNVVYSATANVSQVGATPTPVTLVMDSSDLPYIPMTSCPPNLTLAFKKATGKFQWINKVETYARELCMETLAKLQNGGSITDPPQFDPDVRPVIADGSIGTTTEFIQIKRDITVRSATSGRFDGLLTHLIIPFIVMLVF